MQGLSFTFKKLPVPDLTFPGTFNFKNIKDNTIATIKFDVSVQLIFAVRNVGQYEINKILVLSEAQRIPINDSFKTLSQNVECHDISKTSLYKSEIEERYCKSKSVIEINNSDDLKYSDFEMDNDLNNQQDVYSRSFKLRNLRKAYALTRMIKDIKYNYIKSSGTIYQDSKSQNKSPMLTNYTDSTVPKIAASFEEKSIHKIYVKFVLVVASLMALLWFSDTMNQLIWVSDQVTARSSERSTSFKFLQLSMKS